MEVTIEYSYILPGAWATQNGRFTLSTDDHSVRWIREFLQDRHPDSKIKAVTVVFP